MSLSKQSIENLLDLVEIKLGCMQVLDRLEKIIDPDRNCVV